MPGNGLLKDDFVAINVMLQNYILQNLNYDFKLRLDTRLFWS